MSQSLSLTFKTTGTMVSGIAPTALANLTMTGSLPYNFPPNMTPTMGARDASQSLDQSSGYPSPRHLTQPSSIPPHSTFLKQSSFFRLEHYIFCNHVVYFLDISTSFYCGWFIARVLWPWDL
jgi:hypothetical protein